MQNSKKDQGKYTEYSTHDYLDDLLFENVLPEKEEPQPGSHLT